MKKGFKHKQETKDKMKVLKLGRKRKPFTKEHILNMSIAARGKKFSEETRKKLSESHKGEKSYLWRGGLTEKNKIIRHSLEYRLWREAVFKRDNYTCIWCQKIGGELHPDHIKPFAIYPEIRFAIDNGRTLCIGCHKKTDTYGYKTRETLRKQQ